jgi:hypothetical protein
MTPILNGVSPLVPKWGGIQLSGVLFSVKMFICISRKIKIPRAIPIPTVHQSVFFICKEIRDKKNCTKRML